MGRKNNTASVYRNFVCDCLYSAFSEKNEADKKANLKWLFCTAIAFLASGSIGIMQKIHQTSTYAGELNEFLIVSFLTGSVLSAVMAIVLAVKNKTENNQSVQKRSAKEILVFILLFVLIGVGMAANHKLNLYLVGVLPATVFFPVVNGGALILTSLTAFIVFKEKLTKNNGQVFYLGLPQYFC